MKARKTLIVTNDFPPRQGGIQSYVHALAVRQPPGSVVVYASSYPGDAAFDADQPFPVIRHGGGLLVPSPRARSAVVAAARMHGCTAAWFGAAAPLGMLAPALRHAGVERIVASTHGHEVGWAALPGARTLLRRIGDECDVVTYISEYTRGRLASVIGRRAQLAHLPPGVDTDQFRPDVSGAAVRAAHGLAGRPVVVCVSRLVPRKGQDVLIRVLPEVRRHIPEATLLLVGGGPFEASLRSLAERVGVSAHVVFAGAVAHEDLPAHYAAGDVFAMPCRTRRGGLDVEGLGIVFLEASATGLAVLVGDSGGAPDAVRDAQTGFLVDGSDDSAVAGRLVELLRHQHARVQLGAAGRQWMVASWRWDVLAERLRDLLDG